MPRRRRPPASSARLAPGGDRPVPERLLAAAMRLLRTESLQGLSQARVAAAAGLRQSHLTYYFPTRADLIEALVRFIHAEMKAAFDAALPVTGGAALSIADVREFFADRARDPLLARLMLALMNAADDAPATRRRLVEFDDVVVGQLREILSRAGLRTTEDELALLHASLVGAAILGTQLGRGSDAGIARAAHLTRLAFDRLVEGASPPVRGAVLAARPRAVAR